MNKRNEDGKTALILAAKNGHAKCVEVLIQAGADVNKRDVKKNQSSSESESESEDENDQSDSEVQNGTALMFASDKGHCECITTLIKAGSDVNARDKKGWTPLMFTAGWDMKEELTSQNEQILGCISPSQENQQIHILINVLKF